VPGGRVPDRWWPIGEASNDTITDHWAVPSSRAQIAHSSNVVSMIALRRRMCNISETARQLIHIAIMNLWGRANF
jgi:hypothetical protein